MLQYRQKEFIFDLNYSLILFKDRLELGVSYRNKNTLVAMTQIRINSQLCFGYAYDYAFGKPSVINTSHEIMMRCDLKFRVNTVSPLYLLNK